MTRSTALVLPLMITLTIAALLGAPAVAQTPSGGAAIGAPEPVRLASEVFGGPIEIEIRDLPRPRAQTAIRAAILEAFEISVLADPDGTSPTGVGAVNRAAGEAVTVDPRIAELLVRAQRYCIWSENAHGPLGGALYGLWQATSSPNPQDVRAAIDTAACDQLEILPGTRPGAPPRARLAPGSRIDTRGMVRGFAVDRAIEMLRSHGARNAMIELDGLVRAVGPGLDHRGWPVAVPGAGGSRHPLDQIWLADRSLAVVRADTFGSPPIDLRDGVPARGVVQVATVSELAMDVESLATTLFVLGLPSGKRLLGRLSPRPGVFWLLGTASGKPLESSYQWSTLDRVGSKGPSARVIE